MRNKFEIINLKVVLINVLFLVSYSKIDDLGILLMIFLFWIPFKLFMV